MLLELGILTRAPVSEATLDILANKDSVDEAYREKNCHVLQTLYTVMEAHSSSVVHLRCSPWPRYTSIGWNSR